MKPSVGFSTSNELIEAIKRRAYVPNAQNTITNDDILLFLNEEMKDSVVPLIKSSKEEYMVYSQYVPLVANQDRYVIPYRAIGGVLRDVKFRDTQNNLYAMTRIQPEDRHYFQGDNGNRHRIFFIEGDEIVMFPGVGSSPTGGLELQYYLRPNELVDEDRVGQLTGINTTTGVLTVDALPQNIMAGDLIDLLQWKPGHRTVKFDVPVISVNDITNEITVAVIPELSELAINDIVASAGECVVPQIPPELQSLLVERVVSRCHQAQGDTEAFAISENKLTKMENTTSDLIKNRTEGNLQKINNMNGTLRYAKFGRRRFT